jgi:hypothetical protein
MGRGSVLDKGIEQRVGKIESFATSLPGIVAAQGSAPVCAPLVTFLDRCMAAPDLRKSVADSLPALIADIAHFLHVSHGRHPGVVDHAANRITDEEAREWLRQATLGFAAERAFLNALTVAAGPIRRHLDQPQVEAVLAVQHRSFEMLATSDRRGCPAGAAVAFVLDWRATRGLLERSALMLGLDAPQCTLPNEAETLSLADALSAQDRTMERAMGFGSDQLLAQQKGLWQLIAARHQVTVSL